jgi:hypothetical protein
VAARRSIGLDEDRAPDAAFRMTSLPPLGSSIVTHGGQSPLARTD